MKDWLRTANHSGDTRWRAGPGAVDAEGRIIGLAGAYEPHRDEITSGDQAQIYQAIMGDAAGQPTWSLLRGTRNLKDNRIPPQGFKAEGADAAHIAPQGVAADANFHARANGRDQVTYRIALGGNRGPLEVQVELLYQSVPPETVTRLLNSTEPAAQQFAQLYAAMDKQPERVEEARLRF